jgi:hypoxanthine-guanine phosphoribosyltransferase
MEDRIREIFYKITERFDVPVRIGSRCEAHAYYRIEDLSAEDLDICSEYLSERVDKVCYPNAPEVLIALPGSFTGLTELLSRVLSTGTSPLQVITIDELNGGNGKSTSIKDKNVMLVNDVITTARSCLEAHTQVTLLGASILCWGTLVDRTFGPGPVPVISAFTGEPVILLEELP